LKTGVLRLLVRSERAVSGCLDSVMRLRMHVWALRRALALLVRRVERAPGSNAAQTLGVASEVQADLTTLARATVTSYQALLISLRESRGRLARHR
jgi:hypothetical protein